MRNPRTKRTFPIALSMWFFLIILLWVPPNPSCLFGHSRAIEAVFTLAGRAHADEGAISTRDRAALPAAALEIFADFTANPTSGIKPLTVNFTDTSTGKVKSRSWDFGDGKFSTSANPSHVYRDAGVYTVRYTATGPEGSDTVTKADLITVSYPPPVASFETDITNGTAPLRVTFKSTSQGKIASRLWDLGDGETSTADGPHLYRAPGIYTVTLTVTGPGGSSTATKPNYIQVNDPPPVAKFSATPVSGGNPLSVVFTDQSKGNITSWLWDFGDGNTGNTKDPSHTYTQAGVFTVKLTATGPGGSSTATKVDFVTVHGPPVAAFSAAPLTGIKPHAVSFTDTSMGKVKSRLWEFGDGKTSTTANPSHTYYKPGVYDVKYTVTGPGGSRTVTQPGLITVSSPPPVANFEADIATGTAPLPVVFKSTSTGKITSRLWNFGDGETSTTDGPHVYKTAGTYTVTLTVTGPGGSHTETKLNYIQVNDPPPVAKFSATPVSGGNPLSVVFTDQSQGNATSWLWDFGDGNTDATNTKDASHTYTQAGVFTVKLTATGPGGSSTATKTDYITVHGLPTASFTADPVSGIRPLPVYFTDTSTGKVTSRLWDFGDEKTSTSTNPSHSYAPGSYTVTLTVTGPGGSDTVIETDLITVNYPPPEADFTADITEGGFPLKVNFTDTSVGPVSTRLWDFGDGTSDSYGRHVYQGPGSYTVSLTVTGPGGSDTVTKNGYINIYTPPTADFDADPLKGRAPHAVTFSDLSTGDVSSWLWELGDGTTSSEKSPSHTYSNPATYTVTLTTTGPGGVSTVTKADYVTVKPPLRSVNFLTNFAGGATPRTVKFTDISSGNFASRLWDFGDGQSSAEQDPTHAYDVAGTYTVTLSVDGPDGPQSVSDKVTLVYDDATPIGSIDFSYATQDQTGLLDPWSTAIPGIGPLGAVSVVRTNIVWDDFEPVNGQYADGLTPKVDNPKQTYALAAPLKAMFSRMDEDGLDAVLTIRALSKDDDQFWPFEGQTAVGISHVPRDLETSPNAEYGYSKEYYDYVNKLMKAVEYGGYGAKLMGVVVENEMSSPVNFSGSVDEYCRMAATARKAVKDVFPDMPVYCGGLQGGPAIWVLLDKYLAEGKEAEALSLYHGFKPFDKQGIGDSMEKLRDSTSAKMQMPEYAWLKEALASSLYKTGREPQYDNLPLDGLNVHNYAIAKVFEPLFRDLLEAYTDRPIVSNELGIHVPEEILDLDPFVRQQMVQKLTKAKFHMDRFGLWFSVIGKDNEHLGMLVDAENMINENNAKTFKTFSDLLAPREVSKGDFSDAYNRVARFEFLIPETDKIVTVVWLDDDEEVYLERVPDGATVYDTLGVQVPVAGDFVALTPGMPVFMER